jgi:hypothetical protein
MSLLYEEKWYYLLKEFNGNTASISFNTPPTML